MAQYTYSSSNGRLGSFEGLGKSQLGDQRLGTFGAFGATDQEYLNQVQADIQQATAISNRCNMPPPSGLLGSPQCAGKSFTYWEFKNKTPLWVLQNGPAYIKRYAGRIQASGGAAAKEDSGPSAGEVLTGVGTILGAVANPLANIFATTQRARLERERLKRGGAAPGADPNAALYAALAARNQGGGGGNTTVIILAVVMLVVIIGAVLLLK